VRGFVVPVAFSCLWALAAPANLLAELVTNQWFEFSFTTTGVEARGCFPADPADSALDCIPSSAGNTLLAPAPPWVFTVQPPFATLIVTDAFLHGDAFVVFDNDAEPIFLTPVVPVDGNGCGDNPVTCLADPNASHATFELTPGSHSITITPYAIGDAGAAYFEVVPAPEPCEWPGLVISGIVACAALRRRLRST
jgi:hypothetical protein